MISPSGQAVSVSQSKTGDASRFALLISPSGPLYTLSTMSLPTSAPVPSTPSLVSPGHGSTNVALSPTFTWSCMFDADTYHLQVSQVPNFGSTVVDESELSNTSYQGEMGLLGPGTTYYWRVQAQNTSGDGDWSPTWSFTTTSGSGPPAPTLSCSNCTAAGQHPSFSWTATAPGGTYQVYRGQCEVGDADCYADPFWRCIYNGTGTSLVDGSVTVWQKTGANPVPTSVYFYAVTATDQSSRMSPKSNIQSVNSSDGWISKTAKRETPEEREQELKPDVYRLYPNYPNPFNPLTTIYYTLPEDQHVQLVVVNVLGQEVARLVDGFENAGYKKVEFQAGSLPSGVYYYHLKAGTFDDVKKMLIAK